MSRPKDKKSKKCLNPWYKFIAILCLAVLTLFAIYGARSKNTISYFMKFSSKDDRTNEYIGNVLVASSGSTLKSDVAVQFETCRNFIVVNPAVEKYVSFSNNPNSYSISMVQKFIRKNNVEAVIAGTMNIATYQMLHSTNVEVYTGVTGNAENALKMYKTHELISSDSPNYMNKISL